MLGFNFKLEPFVLLKYPATIKVKSDYKLIVSAAGSMISEEVRKYCQQTTYS